MKVSILTDGFIVKCPDEALAALKSEVPEAEINCIAGSAAGLAELADSDVVYGWLPQDMIRQLKNLKWLHLPSAGANNYTDVSLYVNPSIILTKSSGTFGIPIAEHVIGMMIALSRNFALYHNAQKEGKWNRDRTEAIDIYNSNILLLGLGDIGTQVCRRLAGFDCNIIGFRRDASVPHELVSEVRPMSRLRESLPEADYVLICLPGTEETSKVMGREEFSVMKKQAIVINIGRGTIIDTDALVDALNEGRIAGAGLDVTDPEPLPPDHPLWSAANVLITPHISSLSPRNDGRRLAIFTDLLKRYVSGREMYNIVDFSSGY